VGVGDIRSERDLHPAIGRMVWFLRRQPGEIKALIVIKNDAPTHHFTKLGTAWRDGYKSDRHRSADKLQSGFHHRMPFGESLMESIGGMNGIIGSSGQRRKTRCLRRNLAGGGLPDPAFWLPKPRAELRYRHCDSYGRIDVAVFSSSFAGISYPITARLLSSASSRLATRRRMPRADQGRVTERLDRLLVQD